MQTQAYRQQDHPLFLLLGGSRVPDVLKCSLQQKSIKLSCLPRRVIICLRALVGPIGFLRVPNPNASPVSANWGKKKKKKIAMKQLNKLAGTAPSAAALLKTHLQRPWKTLRPGLITCHGSNGAIPSSCPQASAGPGRDMRAARTQQHRTTFSQERLHCPLSNER